MGAPDGPHSCVPALFFFVGRASSAIVYVFQICAPVAAFERDETAPEAAALIVGRRAGRLFSGRDGHVEPPAIETPESR